MGLIKGRGSGPMRGIDSNHTKGIAPSLTRGRGADHAKGGRGSDKGRARERGHERGSMTRRAQGLQRDSGRVKGQKFQEEGEDGRTLVIGYAFAEG